VADENVSGPSADAEAPNGHDVIEDKAAEPETTDAPEGVADVENVPEEAAPEQSEASPEPEASAEPESTEEPAEGSPGTSADAEVPSEAPAAESTEEPAEGSVEAVEESVTVEEPEPAAESPDLGVSSSKKRKRLPRSLRRQRSKPTRERSAERKPIARLPKPEHERGRRQERQGTVVSAAADKTIIVRVDTVKVHPMYKKVIKRSTKLHAHDETNEAKVGDIVRVVETRPLSKLKRWRLQEIVEAAK